MSSAHQSQQWLLARRPVGLPTEEDFTWQTVDVAAPGEGEVLVKMRYLSLDPAMRGWMREGRSYLPPIKLGAVIRAYGVGEVIASGSSRFAPGDFVTAPSGLQSFFLTRDRGDLRKIDPDLCPVTWHLGVVGMTGLTAWFGLFDIGQPKEGETVVVSGAAGAVGSVVGQLARLHGCRVVGIAGGSGKCRVLTEEMGFHGAVDYRAGGLVKNLAAACPDGVDVFFDNVGGSMLEAGIHLMNDHGRLPICGAISQYNATEAEPGPRNMALIIARRLKLEGFIVMDYAERYGEAVPRLASLAREGRLQVRETFIEGLANFPEAFGRLFSGEKMGKLMLAL
ncbi:MAG: NADP-dependent oxidoreductase [Myxococcales bacterium]|nr:NADP-dependent oxidoreductase [Myxococcales bacterium]